LFVRFSPHVFNGLANTTATLGSFYWLGFETSGLSPDKKRLAWLGAQQWLLADRHIGRVRYCKGGLPKDESAEIVESQWDWWHERNQFG
jgi:hypothetical protein